MARWMADGDRGQDRIWGLETVERLWIQDVRVPYTGQGWAPSRDSVHVSSGIYDSGGSDPGDGGINGVRSCLSRGKGGSPLEHVSTLVINTPTLRRWTERESTGRILERLRHCPQ